MGEKEGKGGKEKKGAVDDGAKKKEGGGGEKKKEGGGGEKKEEGQTIVILKVDMHCEGCASKIKRSVKSVEGVEGVTVDMASNKLTVRGKADPWMLRDRVEAKARKKVEIVSPVNPPKKEADGVGKKPTSAVVAGDSKDQKKSPELAVSTAVLHIRLHCDGCIQRIKKTILKVKGVQEVSVDAQNDLVMVKGTMDVNSMPWYLRDKLKRGVEIVSTKIGGGGSGGGGEKKDKAGGEKANEKEGGGGEKKKEKEGGGGGGEKKEAGGGDEKKKEKEGGGGGDGGAKKEEAAKVVAAAAMVGAAAVETNIMDYHELYGHRVEMMVHAPQLFSDENPNACSIM